MKKLTSEEMGKLLYTAIEISENDLRLLAHQRASAAKTYLIESGNVAIGRLFIIEPDVKAGNESQTMHNRVKFGLI